jgi:SAM-dependent methyltransferase
MRTDYVQRTCPACQGPSMRTFGPALVKCGSCGLAYYPEDMAPEVVSGLYGELYFHGDEYYDYVAQRPALDANFSRRLGSVGKYLPPNASVVELGCAYGFFLALIKDRVASHIGFDISEPAVAYARSTLGVNATTDEFLNWYPVEPIDMVVMWDFIEHVINPEAFLAHSAAVLKPGGYVVLTTGDIGAFVPRLRRLRWRMIHPPTHVYYFTVASLGAVMRRHGLQIVRVRHPAVWRNAHAMLDQVVRSRQHGIMRGLGRRVARLSWLQRLDVPLNLWDIMEVVAVKSDGRG